MQDRRYHKAKYVLFLQRDPRLCTAELMKAFIACPGIIDHNTQLAEAAHDAVIQQESKEQVFV